MLDFYVFFYFNATHSPDSMTHGGKKAFLSVMHIDVYCYVNAAHSPDSMTHGGKKELFSSLPLFFLAPSWWEHQTIELETKYLFFVLLRETFVRTQKHDENTEVFIKLTNFAKISQKDLVPTLPMWGWSSHSTNSKVK